MNIKRYYLFFLLTIFIFFTNHVLGQLQHKIDSLKAQNETEKNPENIIYNLNSIGEYFSYSNVDSAVFYSNKALEMSKKYGYKDGEGESYYMLSYYHDQLGEYQQTIEMLELASQVFAEIKDTSYLSGCFNNLGVVYSYGIDHLKSLEYFIAALDLAEKSKDNFALAESYSNIGAFYEELKEYSSAIKYYQKGLDIDLESGYAENIAFSYLDIANIQLKMHRFNEALENLHKAREIIPEIQDKYRHVELYNMLTSYFIETNNPDSAIIHLKNAESVVEIKDYPRLQAEVISLRGDVCFERKEYIKSYELYSKALVKYESIQATDAYYDIYMYQAKALSELGKHKEAYTLVQKADSVLSTFKPNAIAERLGVFEKQEALKEEKARQKLEMELLAQKSENEMIRMRSNLQLALFSIILLAIVLAISVYFYLSKRRHSALLEEKIDTINQQKILLEENYEKLEISEKHLANSNATKDKFFSIIAHDLRNHFNILIGMSDIILNDPGIKHSAEFTQVADGMYQAAKTGNNLLENLLEWARSQTGDLKHNPNHFPINDCIRLNASVLQEQAKNKEITIVYENQSNKKVYADYDMVNCVMRNLISNAIKFSHPKNRIELSTAIENEICIVSVKDFGVGIGEKNIKELFQIESTVQSEGTNDEQGTGLGLVLCKEFVERNNGKIWVESEIGKGSQFSFSLPLGSLKD